MTTPSFRLSWDSSEDRLVLHVPLINRERLDYREVYFPIDSPTTRVLARILSTYQSLDHNQRLIEGRIGQPASPDQALIDAWLRDNKPTRVEEQLGTLAEQFDFTLDDIDLDLDDLK